MTQETLLVVGLDDVAAIRFDCKCGGSAAISPDHHMRGPIHCPQCGEYLANDTTIFTMVSGFVNGLAQARKLKQDSFTVRLVLTPSASRASGA